MPEIKSFLKFIKNIEEDAPVNNVGSGHIAGVSPGEIPPVRKKKKNPQTTKWTSQRALWSPFGGCDPNNGSGENGQ